MFAVSPVRGNHALRIEGELDLATAPRLQEALNESAASGGPVVLDVRGLTFMDSAGIHACLEAAAILKDQGWCLFVHGQNGSIRRLMEIVALDSVANVHVDYDGPSVPVAG